MPKEVIKIPDLVGDGEKEWREVHIGWQNSYGYVELITRRVYVSDDYDPHDATNGQAVHLDSWPQINELIRKLQLARDGAFGRPA